MTSRKIVASATSQMMTPRPGVDLISPYFKLSGMTGPTGGMCGDHSWAPAKRLPGLPRIDLPRASHTLDPGTCCLAMVAVGIVMLYGPSPALAQLNSFAALDGSTVTIAGAAGARTPPPVDFRPDELPFELPRTARESDSREKSGVHWISLVGEEFFYITLKTGVRSFQPKTRDNFGGPFFHDWGYILQHINVDRWGDGGKRFTNYVGHPLDGSIYTFIYRRNDNRIRNLKFDLHDREYRKGILKSFLVAALASTEAEIGPLSEATIGHVGLKAEWFLRGKDGTLQGPVPQDVIGLPTLTKSPYWVRGGNGTGLTDFIMTPFGGTAVMLGEDAVDKYVIERLEQHIHNRYWVATIRCLLNPTRSAGNFFSFAAPWHRDSR